MSKLGRDLGRHDDDDGQGQCVKFEDIVKVFQDPGLAILKQILELMTSTVTARHESRTRIYNDNHDFARRETGSSQFPFSIKCQPDSMLGVNVGPGCH